MMVTLQNTFMFDLQVESIALRCAPRIHFRSRSKKACSTAGCDFEAVSISASLPSASYHTVSLVGTARSSGALSIRGIRVRLEGSLEREFLLPLANTEEKSRPVSLDIDSERAKSRSLITKNETGSVTGQNDLEDLKYLECQVAPALPLLALRSTNLTHGAMMLYEGEE